MTPDSSQRYRRRILGLGALAFIVLFAIGALIFIPRVENDLEDRVGDELAELGLDDVSVSFSGQDGTLECTTPLDDVAAVRDRAQGLWGVRRIEIDQSCRASTPTVEPPDVTVADTEATNTSAATTEPPGTEPPVTEAPPSTVPELDSIGEIIGGDALFGQLAGLLVTAELTGDDGLGGAGPFTVLAPTDAAFDAAFDELGADAFGALTSDPEMLRTVLLHHVTEGEIRSGDFVDGPLDMLDETTVDVGRDDDGGPTFTSGAAVAGVADPATQLDIEASNGVVHAIDRLLLPDDFDLTDPNAATTGATLANGQLTLTGTVQTEAQRSALVAAGAAGLDPSNVIDQLALDADAGIEQADLDRLVEVIGAMPGGLVSGEATLIADDLTLVGVRFDEESAASLVEVGVSVEATVDVVDRAVADADTAQALQDELNEFVGLNPILFESNSSELTPAATGVVEQVAARAIRLAGTNITIVGFTDTEGDAQRNLTLSQERAAAVLDALVERGFPAEALASEGRGIAEPILDANGVEDRPASRRVEFIVTAQ